MPPSRRNLTSSSPAVRRRAALLVCLALVASLAALFLAQRPASASRARAQVPDAAATHLKARPFVPGEILVRFRDDAKAGEAESRAASLEGESGRAIPVERGRARA